MVSSTHEHHDYLRKAKFGSGPVDRRVVEGDWKPRGFSIAEVTRPPGSALERTTEERDELICVAEGEMHCAVGAPDQAPTVCRIVAGDELFVPAFTPFEARVPMDVGPVRLFVGFE